MGLHRTHIILPQELIEEIDAVVGPRGRSAFMVEAARAELRRRRLLTFLHDDQPTWREKNHPEVSAGSGAWVKRIRSEGEKRVPKAKEPGKRAKALIPGIELPKAP
jgi:hypothetical protein